MRFRVEAQPNSLYVIVPEGREPLPALFDNLEQAQRLADKLCQRAEVSHNTPRELDHGAMLAVS